MLQPAYLNGPGVQRVTLEGPALRIQSRTEADRYLPLARLSRIVSRGPVQWSTPALLECLRSGISVTFLDREGRLIGQCHSACPQPSPLSELLDRLVAGPEGPARLVDWFRSQSRCRILKLLRRHAIPADDLRIRPLRRRLRQVWRQRYGCPEPVTALKPLLAAHLTQVIADYRIDPALLEPGHDWAGLTTYLAGTLEWSLWHLAFGGHLANATDHRQRVATYQRHADHLEKTMRALIGQLWRWLEREV